ncbi:MAG TPA: hypothetical protein VF044_02425 [Actinomycetota bacterium]
MFARYFVELPLGAGAVEDALTHDPLSWLPGLAETANRRGDELLAEVGFGDGVRVSRRVAITLGDPVRMPSKTVVPLHWEPSEAAGLFPELDADLEVAPLGARRTQVAISARYVPPLGVVGRAIDRAVMSRVAEATLKDFLDRVRDAILLEAERRAASEVSGEPLPG